MSSTLPLLTQAIESLKRGERRRAAALLEQELRSGARPGDHWRTVSRLAGDIGEIDIAIEAARRAADPPTLDLVLQYWATLATFGRSDEAIAEIAQIPQAAQNHPSVLHFRATIASENGDFEQAEQLFRLAIATNPALIPSWFGLATIKTFRPDDPDLAALESLLGRAQGAPADVQAGLFYALGKAWEDCGEHERAFEYYSKGAAIRRGMISYDPARIAAAVDKVIRDFTPDAIARLTPSQAGKPPALFVTGLPRSGTTLVQQMLTAHSAVGDGGEVNLMRRALIPTLDMSLDGALAYQDRSDSDDPWGEIAQDYAHFIGMRFRGAGMAIDKSLGQSAVTALQLHSMPDARVIWLRRDPEDTALSCFRTHFTSPAPWSWSLADIARHFRDEDRFYEHWQSVFGDRILTVPYEELVRDPQPWIDRMLAHAGLAPEAAVRDFHLRAGNVKTASLAQVRSPVSTSRIGQAQAYGPLLDEFRQHYRAR